MLILQSQMVQIMSEKVILKPIELICDIILVRIGG